jgi:hypothetical protein
LEVRHLVRQSDGLVRGEPDSANRHPCPFLLLRQAAKQISARSRTFSPNEFDRQKIFLAKANICRRDEKGWKILSAPGKTVEYETVRSCFSGVVSELRDILERNVGQTLELRLKSGEKIGGKVAKLGDKLVFLSQLTGAEFYDAAVEIGDVAAVVVRVRNQ